jgi:putative two-component system response regulator
VGSQPRRRSTASVPTRRRARRARWSSVAISSQAEDLRALDLSTALQLAALVESSDDAVIVLSLQGLIATWSKGAERLFGYSQTEAVGQRIAMLAPADRRAESRTLLARVFAGEQVEAIETEWVAKEGRRLNVSLAMSPITAADEQLAGVAGIVRDLSAQRIAEGALQASDELYGSVVEALDDGVILIDPAGRVLAANESAGRILGHPTSELVGRSFSNGYFRARAGLIHEDGSPFLEDAHPSLVSIRTSEPQVGVVMGIERHGRATLWLSVNSRPLRHPGELKPYAAVSSFTDITAIRDTLAELKQARFDDLKRLALAAEYRDDDTHRHTERVARVTELLARELGIEGEQLVTLRAAAPLHDVGKIGIPDRILLKPASLTPGEFEEMKSHTTIGARILGESGSATLQMGSEIALSHHERWDGTGYPAGLHAEAIPPSGRIVAVADVFDAITHTRPYKEARPVAYAVEEITRSSGTQFDPRVVEAFATLRHHELVEVR